MACWRPIGERRALLMDRDKVRDFANRLLISAVTDMSNASTEAKVKSKMSPEFRDGGCIDFPSWDSAVRGGCYYYFRSFIDK